MNEYLAPAAVVLAALASGPIWSMFTERFKIGAAKQTADNLRLLQDHDLCKAEIVELRTQMAALAASQNSFLARWIKDRSKRVAWVNDLAFMTLFAPLGFSRDELHGKTFAEIGFESAAIAIIDELDRLALAHPGVPQSRMISMPDGQRLVVLKVAGIGSDGEVRYEGSAYPPIEGDKVKGLSE